LAGDGGHVPVTAASFATDNAPNAPLQDKIPPHGEVAPLTGFNHKYNSV